MTFLNDDDRQSLAQAMCNPGRLVLGPTQITGAFPYGGVALGFHSDAEIVWRTDLILSQDVMSHRVTEAGRHGEDFPEIYCLLSGVQWDENFLLGAFQRAIASSALPYPDPPETRIQGGSIPFGVKAWPPMLFAANDPTHKSVYFTRPLPTLSLREGVAIAKTRQAGLPVRFIPTPTSEAGIPDWQVVRLENMIL